MLYEINLFDFNWVLLTINFLILFGISRYVFRNELIKKKSKVKFITAFSVIWSGLPLYILFVHVYANWSYQKGGYATVKGVVNRVVEDGRFIAVKGKGINLRYSTASGRCLTDKINISQNSKVVINFIFEENDVCILSMREIKGASNYQ
jgi:hypothetical protein